MIYRAVDIWNSPYLEHYGVKGMKWGVRHDTGRSGPSFIDRLRSRAEERRIRKNEKAIASGDPRKVAKRFKKMTNEELKRAMERLNERRKIEEIDRYLRPEDKSKNNNGGGGRQQDNVIARNLRNTADTFVRNSINSAVTSAITGERFVDALKKSYGGKTSSEKAAERVQKEADNLKRLAANSRNRLTELENNKKIQDFNKRLEIARTGDYLKNYSPGTLKTQDISNRRIANIYTPANAARRSALMNQVMKTSAQVPITSITMRYGDQNRANKHKLVSSGRYGNYLSADYVYHDDEDSSFLAHYGVKGMRWGVRKQAMTTIENAKIKSRKIRTDSNRTFKSAVNNAKRFSKSTYKNAVKFSKSISDINRMTKYAQKASKIAGSVYTSSVLAKSGATALITLASNPYVAVGAAAIGAGAVGYGVYKHFKHSDNVLMHYGVKGMKWGVRKDRNGSHSLEKHAIAEPEAWKKYKENWLSTYDDPKGNTIGKKKVSAIANAQEIEFKKQSVKKLVKSTLSTVGGAGVGAASVVAAVNGVYPAIYGVGLGYLGFSTGLIGIGSSIHGIVKQNMAESAEKKYFKDRKKNSVVDKKTGLYKKTKELTSAQDLKACNPGFGRHNSNYHNNCGLCTIAYDLRRRGYDVTARKSNIGTTIADVSQMYKGAKHKVVDGFDAKTGVYDSRVAVKNLEKELSKQKNTRGDIRVKWDFGGGHSMAYEVDNKGKVKILCGQTNKTYSKPNDILKYGFAYAYCRLDNLEPNINLIKKEAIR